MTEKIKVTSLDIIVRMIKDEPYYEIKYKEVGNSYYNVGYSSYNLENVLKWKEECFDLVGEKETSGDGMTEDELTMLKNLNVLRQYRSIGTVEECRAAMEKQKVKRPDGGRDIDGNDYLICPNCCAIVADGELVANFCSDCGQKLDWSDVE